MWLALTSATLVLAACRPSVSADDLDAALTKHPEVLYRAIERHPAEMIAALNKAAQVSQVATQQNSARLAAEKTEAELANPKVPSPDRRIAFGNPKAPITIVEYSDFQCPYCRRERDVLVEVMKRYGDTVRLIVKQTPLEMHPHAMKAALANVAAHELSEAVTDPYASGAWYDATGNENADKCAWVFNQTRNALSNGTTWKLQGNWSNAAYSAGTGFANSSGQKGCKD